ncbi:MAG: hypothetical protein ACLSVD_07390 [Eggerthellaceae bacterium]
MFDRMVTALFDAGDLSGLLEIDDVRRGGGGMRPALFWIMAGVGRPSISHELLSYEGPFAWVTVPRSRCRARPATALCGLRLTAMRIVAVRDAAANDAPVDPYAALARASVAGSCARATP